MVKLTQYFPFATQKHFVEDFHDDIQQCATYLDISYPKNSSQRLPSGYCVPGTLLRVKHKLLFHSWNYSIVSGVIISVLHMTELSTGSKCRSEDLNPGFSDLTTH